MRHLIKQVHNEPNEVRDEIISVANEFYDTPPIDDDITFLILKQRV